MEIPGTVVSIDGKTAKIRLMEPIEVILHADKQVLFRRVQVQVSGHVVPQSLVNPAISSEFHSALARLRDEDFNIPSNTAAQKAVAELIKLARASLDSSWHVSSLGAFSLLVIRTISEYLIESSTPITSHLPLLRRLARALSLPNPSSASQALLEFIKVPLRMHWEEEETKTLVIQTVKLLSALKDSSNDDNPVDLNADNSEVMVDTRQASAPVAPQPVGPDDVKTWEAIFRKLYKQFRKTNSVFRLSHLQGYIERHRPQSDRAFDWIVKMLRTLVCTTRPRCIVDDSDDAIVAPRSEVEINVFIERFAKLQDYRVNRVDLVALLVRLLKMTSHTARNWVKKWIDDHEKEVTLVGPEESYEIPTSLLYSDTLAGFPALVIKSKGDTETFQHLERMKKAVADYMKENNEIWNPSDLHRYMSEHGATYRRGIPEVPKSWKLRRFVESLGYPPMTQTTTAGKDTKKYPSPRITNLTHIHFNEENEGEEVEVKEEEMSDEEGEVEEEGEEAGDGRFFKHDRKRSAVSEDTPVVQKAVKVKEEEETDE